MEDFGYPPNFDVEEIQAELKEVEIEDFKIVDKSKSKKSKAGAKSINAKYQWQIMQSLGLSDEDIKKFAEPLQWIEYFSPQAISDCISMGLKTDWRRSFVTVVYL
jgi:leucyl-tRNA synthetase